MGVGWDLALLGLGLHLRDPSSTKPEGAEDSPEARRFIVQSSAAWGAALAATGASSAQVAQAVANTTAFYAPDPASDPGAPKAVAPDADAAKPAGASA